MKPSFKWIGIACSILIFSACKSRISTTNHRTLYPSGYRIGAYKSDFKEHSADIDSLHKPKYSIPLSKDEFPDAGLKPISTIAEKKRLENIAIPTQKKNEKKWSHSAKDHNKQISTDNCTSFDWDTVVEVISMGIIYISFAAFITSSVLLVLTPFGITILNLSWPWLAGIMLGSVLLFCSGLAIMFTYFGI